MSPVATAGCRPQKMDDSEENRRKERAEVVFIASSTLMMLALLGVIALPAYRVLRGPMRLLHLLLDWLFPS